MVVEYVSSIKAAWDIAKAVKVSTDAIDDAQVKLQMAELIATLADARVQAAESAERIAELEKLLKVKQELQFDGEVYFQVDEEANTKSGPWCPTCFDARNLQIRLQSAPKHSNGKYKCYECRAEFGRDPASNTWAPRGKPRPAS